MAEKYPKKDLSSFPEEYDDAEKLLGSRRPGTVQQKTLRRIHPLGFRVVVRIHPDNNMSEGGLYLPEGAKQNMAESVIAEVVEVASALDSRTNEETNVSGVPLGAKVLIPKAAGTKVPWDDELRVIETKEVLGLVDEISVV